MLFTFLLPEPVFGIKVCLIAGKQFLANQESPYPEQYFADYNRCGGKHNFHPGADFQHRDNWQYQIKWDATEYQDYTEFEFPVFPFHGSKIGEIGASRVGAWGLAGKVEFAFCLIAGTDWYQG